MNPSNSDRLAEAIRRLHHAETSHLSILPRMALSSANEDLADAFAELADETRIHITRLEEAARVLNIDPAGGRCRALADFVGEIEEFLELRGRGAVRDLGLITAGQRIAMFQIAAYGAAEEVAEKLGAAEIVDVLAGSAGDEAAAERLLSAISVRICRENIGLGAPAYSRSA
ncbi:MAG: DUF892 family protein [Verrucomicrobiae bacterium]|nr:DUF892 family protein [Verrucomicrobiae bacterium]